MSSNYKKRVQRAVSPQPVVDVKKKKRNDILAYILAGFMVLWTVLGILGLIAFVRTTSKNDVITASAESATEGSVGLMYQLNSDGNSYTCIGSNGTSPFDIVIASEYNGMPVTKIAQMAFYENDRIKSVVIPDSVVWTGPGVFMECDRLESAIIGNNCTLINSDCFYSCDNLSRVVIGSSVGVISSLAFADCKNLTDIIFNGTEEEWNSISFGAKWKQNTGDFSISFLDPSSILSLAAMDDSFAVGSAYTDFLYYNYLSFPYPFFRIDDIAIGDAFKVRGVTVTLLENGSLQLQGTANGSYNFVLSNYTDVEPFLVGGHLYYLYSGNGTLLNPSRMTISYFNGDTIHYHSMSSGALRWQSYYRLHEVYFNIQAGDRFNASVIYPSLRDVTSVSTNYADFNELKYYVPSRMYGYYFGYQTGYNTAYEEGYNKGVNATLHSYLGFSKFYLYGTSTDVDESGEFMRIGGEPLTGEYDYARVDLDSSIGNAIVRLKDMYGYEFDREGLMYLVMSLDSDVPVKFLSELIGWSYYLQFAVADFYAEPFDRFDNLGVPVFTSNFTRISEVDGIFIDNGYASLARSSSMSTNETSVRTIVFRCYYDEMAADQAQLPTLTDSSNGVATGYSAGYNAGYNAGYKEGSNVDLSDNAYYSQGYAAGYAIGYDQGYSNNNANPYTFKALMASVIDVPVRVFTSLLDFNVLGVNLMQFFLSLLSVCFILVIIRLII